MTPATLDRAAAELAAGLLKQMDHETASILLTFAKVHVMKARPARPAPKLAKGSAA